MTMTISSRADVRTYVANCQPDLVKHGYADAFVQAACDSDDRPEYGSDWSEWIENNVHRLRAQAVGSVSTWDYHGYWNVVLGADRTAETVVSEFGLAADGLSGLGEWLAVAASEAWILNGQSGPVPSEWAEHAERALRELTAAIEAGST